MEKFAAWTDANGVRPFVRQKIGPYSKLKLGLKLFALLECCLIFILSMWYWLFAFLLFNIPFIGRFPPIRWLLRFFEWVTCRLILVTFGYWRIPSRVTSLIPRPTPESERWVTPSSDSIVFSTLSSPFDILWMGSSFSPRFAIPSGSGAVVYTSFGLVLKLLRGFDLRKGKVVSWERLVSVPGPIVILPEAAPTNAAGILEWVQFSVPCEKRALMIIASSYPGNPSPSPHYVHGPFRPWLFAALSCWRRSVEFLQPVAAERPTSHGMIDGGFLREARDCLSKLTRRPKVSFGVDDYHAFLAELSKVKLS